jgi:fructose-1,6-bisphosphatase/inositol monophosphatase family enzyme
LRLIGPRKPRWSRPSAPRYAVSIGVEHQGEPAIGVVYDPLLDEC